MFRFSLKWILAAMVYAAIAAAAFSQESWVYADLLCAMSLLALGYAAMLVIYARGPRQASAAGFAVFTLLLAMCMIIAPSSVPTERILTAAGVGQTPILPQPITAFPAPANLSLSLRGAPAVYQSPSNNAGWALAPAQAPTVTFAPTPIGFYDITPKLRAANAVATMTCGLVGALLALVAYQRTHPLAATR